MAGIWSLQMNLETGDINKCIGNPYLDNIYEDLCREIKFEAVGHNCKLPYCWNCHAYLTLGVIDGFKAPTYYDVRDRKPRTVNIGSMEIWLKSLNRNYMKTINYEHILNSNLGNIQNSLKG